MAVERAALGAAPPDDAGAGAFSAALIAVVVGVVMCIDMFTDVAVLVLYFRGGSIAAGVLASVAVAAGCVSAVPAGRSLARRSRMLQRVVGTEEQRMDVGAVLGAARCVPAVVVMEALCVEPPPAPAVAVMSAAAVAEAAEAAASTVAAPGVPLFEALIAQVACGARERVVAAACAHTGAVCAGTIRVAPDGGCVAAFANALFLPGGGRAVASSCCYLCVCGVVVAHSRCPLTCVCVSWVY